MNLSKLDKIQIRTIIIRFKSIIGRDPDNFYIYPKCLENIKIVRYMDKECIHNIPNGRIALWLANTKDNNIPVIVFENNLIDMPHEYFEVIENLSEDTLSTKSEEYNANEIQRLSEPITSDDFIDLHIYLGMLDKGIDIFNRTSLGLDK